MSIMLFRKIYLQLVLSGFFQPEQREMYEWRAVLYGFIMMCSTVKHIYFQIDFYYSYFNKTVALCILICVPR